MVKSRTLLLALLVAAVATPALAGPFTLFTGYNEGAGTLLADGVLDTNWTVNGVAATVANDDGYPIPPWLANGPISKWISDQPDPDDIEIFTDLGGLYYFATEFDLTGYDVSGLMYTGRFAVDNSVLDVLLNGVSIGVSRICTWENEPPCYNSWTDISFGGVDAGLNELVFVVQNSDTTGGPMGFRAEISAPPPEAIPEPGTLLLLGSGLTGLALRRRRRKNS